MNLRTLVSLLAGRASYRLVQLAATVALLPLWGPARYATFAGAVAALNWLVALLVAGPEKTVLKLLPRAPRTGPLIVRAAAALLWVLPVPVLAAFAVAGVLAPHAPVTVYLGAAAMTVMTGVLLLLVGLHRALGRPSFDSGTFLALTVVQGGLLGLAAWGLGPAGYLACLVGAQAALCVPMLVKLGRPSLAVRRRPAFARRLACTVVLMGSPDVCLYLCSSVLVALLSASAQRAQVGPFVAVQLVWSAGVNFLLYGLRVYAPQVSLRLIGAGGAGGRHAARRLAGWVVLGDTAYLAIVGGALAAGAGGGIVLWAVLFLARTPMLVALIFAGYLVENSDARSTRVTGAAAVAALLTAVAVGAATVPPAGGAGVLVALAAADVAQAATLRHRLAPRGSRQPLPAAKEDTRVGA